MSGLPGFAPDQTAYARLLLPSDRPESAPGQSGTFQNPQSGKGFELITKPAQSSKPRFNIKETRLPHDPYPQATHGKWNYTERVSAKEFFAPSRRITPTSTAIRSNTEQYQKPSASDVVSIEIRVKPRSGVYSIP